MLINKTPEIRTLKPTEQTVSRKQNRKGEEATSEREIKGRENEREGKKRREIQRKENKENLSWPAVSQI